MSGKDSKDSKDQQAQPKSPKPGKRKLTETNANDESNKKRKLAMEFLVELKDDERKLFLENMKKEVKDRAREKKYTPLTQQQKDLVGKVFYAQSITGNSPPSFVRVIGWAKTGKSAIVENVPSIQKPDSFLQAGSVWVDKKWLEEHPIKQGNIQRIPGAFTEQGRVSKENEIKLPGRQDAYRCLQDLNQEFRWCCD